MDASSDNPNSETVTRLTPMMAQYLEITAVNPGCLLFYRMGDFYELFFEDAEIASRALGIVLTKRGKHEGEDIRMCGVPVERADDYLNRLIALGHRVAVCEQIEDPAAAKKRGPKSVVKRDVVRLVTPGTITEERVLQPGRARLLVAVQKLRSSEGRQVYGLAALDLSTGSIALSETDETGRAAEIARLEPSEVVASQAVYDEPWFSQTVREMRVPATPLARDGGDGAAAERRVCEFYGVETLDGFGAFTRAEIAAAALALAYVKRTQFEARPALSPPTRRARGASLEIDPATRANLELTRTLSGAREGSLLATIDLTVTPAGARLLAERLASPLTDPEVVNRRLDSLDFLVEAAPMRDALRRTLTHAPDFLRALARLSLDRGGPRDLAAVRDGLAAALTLASILEAVEDLPPELMSAYARLRADCAELARDLEATLADDLPLLRRDGGFVRSGAMAALDEALSLREESRRVIAGLQASYADEAGIRQLKIKHNNFLGYFIETSQAAGETLLKPPHSATFIHRQTMAGAMRFSTHALADLASRIPSAADRAVALGLQAFERLRQACVAEGERLRGFGAARAHIGIVDRLFSRGGAADDLARGRSTFMVEMVETAAILNQATARSLVILDEIGRGTATFDGLSIAYACVEHLSAVNRSRALFATHFHELTALAETLPRLVNLTMRVNEFKGTLAFLHEVIHGAADRSYGIQVAKLAGLPPSVVKRARQALASLEASRSSSSLDALPLFSYEPREPPPE